MNKTVYFLGAGFSADAGGPIQNQIIQFILDDKFIEKYKDSMLIFKYLEDALTDFFEYMNAVNFQKEL